MTVPPMSVRILGDQVWLGLETGQISVFLHLGRGHLVKKKVNKLGISCVKLTQLELSLCCIRHPTMIIFG